LTVRSVNARDFCWALGEGRQLLREKWKVAALGADGVTALLVEQNAAAALMTVERRNFGWPRERVENGHRTMAVSVCVVDLDTLYKRVSGWPGVVVEFAPEPSGAGAKIQSTLTSNGAIRQFNDWRTLTFGEQSGEMAERVNVGEIVRTPKGRELFLDQLQCGAAIAAANGHTPSEGFMRSWEETFSQQDSQYATSMLRDIERGGPTEVEHILGFMLNKASEANIAHRTLLLAYTHIKAFGQRRAAGRLP
jgi:hypothetical protein